MFQDLHVSHIHGDTNIKANNEQAIVLCVVKNGEKLIDAFIKHYQSIGFKHIIFIDNDSSDTTIERAKKYSNVTVLHSPADFRTKKIKLKYALLRAFGIGTWSLIVDIDELFHFPHMDTINLTKFIHYLNEYKYDCVVAQMLDMVPAYSLKQIKEAPIESISHERWYFDDINIEKKKYNVKNNQVSNSEIMFWYGGIRKSVFGIDSIFLTKHPFVFGDGDILFQSSHTTGYRNVADISGILLHYKFVGDVYQRTKQAVIDKNFYRDSQEYQHYLEVFESSEDTQLLHNDCIAYENHSTLLNRNLFAITDQYRTFLNDQKALE